MDSLNHIFHSHSSIFHFEIESVTTSTTSFASAPIIRSNGRDQRLCVFEFRFDASNKFRVSGHSAWNQRNLTVVSKKFLQNQSREVGMSFPPSVWCVQVKLSFFSFQKSVQVCTQNTEKEDRNYICRIMSATHLVIHLSRFFEGSLRDSIGYKRILRNISAGIPLAVRQSWPRWVL